MPTQGVRGAERPGAGRAGRPELSRRRLLRLAGAGLGLAAGGAALTGCGPEAEADGPAAKGPDQGTAAPDGGFTTPPPGTAPKPLWQEEAAFGALGSLDALAVAGSTVLVSGDPLVGRDLATGEERWSRKGAAVPGARLILGGGTLYLTSTEYDGDLVGLDPATGKETWRSRLGGRVDLPRPIAADGERVYVLAGLLAEDNSTPESVVAAIDTRTGKVAWSERRDAGTAEHGITSTVAGPHLVYTDQRRNVTVRDAATGRQRWTKKIGRSNFVRLAVHQGLVIVADGDRLRAFDAVTGTERWTLATDAGSTFNGPAVLDGVLHVSDSGRTLWAVDPATGKRIWRNEDLGEAAYPVQFARAGGTLYGATQFDAEGGVHAYEARTGRLRWTYNDGSGSGEQWYVTGSGQRLVAMHGRRVTGLPAV